MSDHLSQLTNCGGTSGLSPEIKNFLNETYSSLRGPEKRKFMARVVKLLGKGGQFRAERELGWDRKTIRKGTKELESGFDCIDNFSGRGRKRAEDHLPDLLNDIKEIVEPVSQADPTFRTTRLYTPLTAEEVRNRLIQDRNYKDREIPKARTIQKKLNELNYHRDKVKKSRPQKKIMETDAIFENVHKINRLADESDGVLRLSLDAKAKVNVGPFSRGGYSRQKEQASDHDFAPDTVLKPFGIFLPSCDETYLYFTESIITADFIADCMEELWPALKDRFELHTLVLNLDNGPENSSRRTQFIKRIVDFAQKEQIDINLIYYPPYHSKYNPIERVWGILEKHWNGEILYSVEKVLGLARSMKWNGKNPAVRLVEGIYEKGIKLPKKIMKKYEEIIERMEGLENWSVNIPCFSD